MKELVQEIRKTISLGSSDKKIPSFNKEGFEAITITKDNFHEVSKGGVKKISFVDGGNAELVASNNFSVQLIRVACVNYKGNKKTFVNRKEFYLIVSFSDNTFTAKILPDNKTFVFDANDESLRDGRAFAGISRVGNFVRRLFELEMAYDMVEKSGIVVLDGSLEEKFMLEKGVLNKLFKKARQNKVLIAGLSKTNSLITEDGSSVSSILESMKEGKWYYHPIAVVKSELFNADMCFAKLHEKSQHVFRIDLHKGSFEELCSSLAQNSRDPVFPGYPYGLIEADRVARISNKEVEYFKTRLMVELGETWKDVKKGLNVKNAHQILDSIS